MTWLARRYSPEKLVEWVSRRNGSRAYYTTQFRHVFGRSLEDASNAVTDLESWLAGTRDDPGNWPGLSALAPARSRKSRHGAILLPFRALLAAMQARS